ncbi:MAG: hypothetical protein PWP65_2133, partial [Clostridia bacterium]|nr:hypothetical protein [Clostridia bacterium]
MIFLPKFALLQERFTLVTDLFNLDFGQFHYVIRQGCIKKVFRVTLAIMDGPPEEIYQSFTFGGIVLLLIHEEVSITGNGIGIFTGR